MGNKKNRLANIEKKESSKEVNTKKKNDDFIEVEGEVIELFPGATFRVVLNEGGQEIIAHLSGRMRMNKIRILPGDCVKVQMTPYDLSKGRIIYRF